MLNVVQEDAMLGSTEALTGLRRVKVGEASIVRRMFANHGRDRSWCGSKAQVRDHINVFDADNGNL